MDIQGVTSYDETATNRVYGSKELGREDFLNLLMKELSCQDPLEPMDSKEFIGQITQFTSLEELTGLNDKLGEVLASQRSMQETAMVNMIGKKVKVDGNSTYLADNADVSYDLADKASSVKVFIQDAGGSTVWAGELGPQDAGSYNFIWDGNDLNGNRMPEGAYSFEVSAMDINGKPVVAATKSSGIITGIVYGEEGPSLVLDGSRKIKLDEINSIDM